MLARTSSILASLFVVTTVAAGCAAPTEEDGVDDQTSNVTGGSGGVDSPVVYLFEGSITKATPPKCVGAMLSETIAVTAKSCAKTGLVVGRATDKDGKGKTAKVKAVHVPDGADAEIAVLELDKKLDGMHALITHMPLRDGYTVNAIASIDGKGLLSPDKNEAASVKASVLEESATSAALVPAKGSEICDGDIGAPVCSSSAFKIMGKNLAGTCGLSGLVIGRADTTAADAKPGAAAGEEPAQPSACSGKAWKVANLGVHADFLKQFAPKAFEPLKYLKLIPYAPDGLYGYQTKGTVKSCTIETKDIASVKAGADTAKLSAKVSFTAMDRKATPFGRFGIAPKSDPTKMRWLPAKAIGDTKGAAYDTQFQGVVNAAANGDYVVGFRVSANGGETWTQCDSDGLENGFQAEKLPTLKISDTSAPTTPPTGTETTPQGEPPTSDYQDAPSTGGTEETSYPSGGEEEEPPAEEETATKKKSDSGGCTVSHSGGASSSLPIGAALLGLAMIARRRRRS
ncbi:MAG: hypothetical protein JST00_25445 [Deltaproteobacteria bacterium]|nr:hypothetical protein [Deltaproteobacteria bacterium]